MYNFNDASLQIENTNLCAASCIMCPRDKFEHKLEIMPMDIFKRIVDEAVLLGINYFNIAGFGEPLMDNLLEERFLYVDENEPVTNNPNCP